MGQTFSFTEGERRIFRKRVRIPVSEWAARNVIVQDGPHAGSRLRMDVTPYLPGIMDTLMQPGVEEVDVCASPQIGKTELMLASLFYSMDYFPGPKMLVMPDEETLDRAVQKKLLKRMRGSAVLRRMLHKVKKGVIELRDGSTTFLASAQSPSQRASVSIMHMFMDEVDLYKQIAGQGAPVYELRERTISYSHKRRVLCISKPLGDETSTIWIMVNEECDELRRFHVVCPACNGKQVMVLDRVVVLEGCKDPREVLRRRLGRYECGHCKYRWTDHARDVAVSRGKWRADEPVPNPRRVGFHLPSLVSRFVSLSEIAADQLAAEESDNPVALKDFYNGRGAMPYRAKELETDEQKILALKCDLPARTVPRGAVALTCGIDVQKRGFWFTVWAWAENLEHWLVDYGYISGGWDDVEQMHGARYPIEGGGEMGIWRIAYDSGGGKTDSGQWTRTEEVYLFVRSHAKTRKIFATKGASHEQLSPVRWTNIDKLPHSGRALRGGLRLAVLDTLHFKGLVHGRMDPDARQPMHLHAETGEDFAAQIAAERLVRSKSGKLEWEVVSRDNHYLDCTVMAYACADASWLPSLQMLARRQRLGRVKAEGKTKVKVNAAAPTPDAMGSAVMGSKPGWLGRR